MRIVFTANDRFPYMREVLDSWSRVRGVGQAKMSFHAEPGHPEMVRVCELASGFAGSSEVRVNDRWLGVQRNPFEAINYGFSDGSDFVILAEDDLVVATDILEYFAWASEKYRKDQSVLAVSAHRQYRVPGGQAAVYVGTPFHIWVWGIWRDRWEQVAPDWTFNYEHNGWDYRLDDYWIRGKGLKAVIPAESRSQHIGEFGGTHMSPWEFQRQLSDSFTQDIPSQQYYEMAGDSSAAH